MFQLDAQPVGDAIYKLEVRDDCTRVMDGAIVKADVAQPANMLLSDGRRLAAEFFGIVQECTLAYCECALGGHVPCDQLTDERVLRFGGRRFSSQDSTEARSVMLYSIMAIVERRHAHGDDLTLAASERPRMMH